MAIAATFLAAADASAAAAEPPSDSPRSHARLSLIADRAALVPGETALLGVHFKIDPRWHIYWPGVNDTGFAPSIKLILPNGYEAEQFQWPAPERHVYPGDILDHIYEGAVTITVPVRVPASAAPGTQATMSVSSEWLVCEEACVPEEGKAELTLPVVAKGSPAAPSPSADAFAKAKSRLPVPLTDAKGKVGATIEAGRLVIDAPGAAGLAFFPGEGCVPMPRLITEGETKSQRLSIGIGPEGADETQPRVVRGVVEVIGKTPSNSKSESSFYLVDLVVPRG